MWHSCRLTAAEYALELVMEGTVGWLVLPGGERALRASWHGGTRGWRGIGDRAAALARRGPRWHGGARAGTEGPALARRPAQPGRWAPAASPRRLARGTVTGSRSRPASLDAPDAAT